ncbi:Protein of unknown function DUF573 [Macleaya cordata]|uniref:Glabrous enhancer-binding protein-like DBD domain-containing protein n=1 Tax=Macleaya cordata TaxID=56857 RepID=A0A200QSU5_MACCD|nr:Protein of unknown function DUF573 [Macleaya cordata]
MTSNEVKEENQILPYKVEDEEVDDFEEDEEEEEDDDLNSFSPSTSSDDPNKFSSTLAAETPLITTPITTVSVRATAPPNGSATEDTPPPSTGNHIKKPSSLDDSRKLFQRLWTDEDEIGLLQGFLDFTTRRGTLNSSYHHETGPFYDHIKTRLQLDFNKNQLVEKLRRLKKKYRNVVTRISSGKEFSFKTPHDQTTFEISRKIWSGNAIGGSGLDEAGVEDDESNHPNSNINNDLNNSNNNGNDLSNSDKKVTSTRRRSQKRAAEDDLSNLSGNQTNTSSIQNVIEDTVRSCLSPLIKELLHCSTNNGSCNLGGLGGVTALNPLPLNFGVNTNSMMNFSSGEMADEKWRKQQILELEVYSKRIELVQDQIKSALDELRSMGSK